MVDLVKVRKFAIAAHTGHFRKYTNEPYIVHPAAVAKTIRDIGGTREMIAAAWLHDTVEDTDATIQEIRENFGRQVAFYVDQLTDPVVIGNRATRIAAALEHTAKMVCEVQSIKLADIHDNSRTICKYDPQFALVWGAEKQNQLRYLDRGDPQLFKLVTKTLETLI